MVFEEDTCAVCGTDRPGAKNPIIFCDGRDCNVAVHKWCYRVESVPKGDWFCQRCAYKRKNKPTEVICCPEQSGAFRYTTIPGGFMHVICAMWNKKIDTAVEPYYVNKQLLNTEECDICHLNQGLCITCQDPQCTLKYHVTCAINHGYILPAKQVSEHYVFYCQTHQPSLGNRRNVTSTSARGSRAIATPTSSSTTTSTTTTTTTTDRRSTNRKNGRGGRKRNRTNRSKGNEEEDDDDNENDQEEDEDNEDNEEEDDEEEDEDDNDDVMDEDHSVDADDHEDDDDDDVDDSDDDMGLTPRKRSKSKVSKHNSNAKRRTLATSRQKTGPIKLFLDDQSESDDDMGTTRSNDSNDPKSNNNKSTTTTTAVKVKKESSPSLSIKSESSPSLSIKSEASTPSSLAIKSETTKVESSPTLSSSTIPSFRERLEAKRKKTDITRTPTSPSLPHKKPSLSNITALSPSSLALDLNKVGSSSTPSSALSSPSTATHNNNNNNNNNNSNSNINTNSNNLSPSSNNNNINNNGNHMKSSSLSNPLDILAPSINTTNATTMTTTTTTTASSTINNINNNNTESASSLSSSTATTGINGSPSINNKQKLPNKAHLSTPSSKPTNNNMINNNNNLNNNTNLNNNNMNNGNMNARSGISSPSNSINNKKLSNASNKPPSATVIKDLDEIQNDIRAGAQRWPNSNMDNNGFNRNPMMDRKNSLQSGMDMVQLNNMMRSVVNEAMENLTVTKEQIGLQQVHNRLQSANQEIGRMKEELRRMQEFKRNVIDVFEGLNVKIAGRPLSSIEEYVSDIKAMLLRSGTISERDRDRVADFVQDTIKGDHMSS